MSRWFLKTRSPLAACVVAALIVVFGFSGCATSDDIGCRSEEPGWWGSHRSHDHHHLYFKANGLSESSLEEARRNALRSIQTQIAQYILSEVHVVETDTLSRVSVESAIELREVDIFAEHQARPGRQWNVWMLGRYPRPEYDRIQERIGAGQRLGEDWRVAQSALNRQQVAEAERLLLKIIEAYDRALHPSFALEEVKLELAGCYLKQNRGLSAAQWITDVIKTTTCPDWRLRAENLSTQVPPVSLKDAFDGQMVAIYACLRRDGRLSMNQDLFQELNVRLARQDVRTLAIRELVDAETTTFDEASIQSIALTAGSMGADAVIVALLDIDSSKTGTTINIPGSDAQMPAHDARLAYWVVRAADGQVLASDATIGRSDRRAAAVNTVLTHRRHLPAHAPAIAEALLKRTLLD